MHLASWFGKQPRLSDCVLFSRQAGLEKKEQEEVETVEAALVRVIQRTAQIPAAQPQPAAPAAQAPTQLPAPAQQPAQLPGSAQPAGITTGDK